MRVGIDSVEKDRFCLNEEKLIARILHPKELHLFSKMSSLRQKEFLAGRFALKESILKALSIQCELATILIELKNNNLTAFIKDKENSHLILSLTHTKKVATAICIINE